MTVQDIAGIGQALIAAIGLTLVMLQLRYASRLSKVQLIAQMNDRLASYHDIISKLRELKDINSWNKLPCSDQERILDYISVYETIESMRRLGTLSIRDVSYFFAGRFLALSEARGAQEAIFYNPEFKEQLYPIFSLHRALRAHRNHDGFLPRNDNTRSLDERDPDDYNRLADQR